MPSAGYEYELQSYLKEFGLDLFGVEPGASLTILTPDAFVKWSGYALAVRPQTLTSTQRAFFTIYPAQLQLTPSAIISESAGDCALSGRAGTMLFNGPSWMLERGFWTLEIDGDLSGKIGISIVERGHVTVLHLVFDERQKLQTFFVDHDLIRFQCFARCVSSQAAIRLRSLRLTRSSERSVFRSVFERGSANINELTRLSQ